VTASAPSSICIFRLSALGDVTHVVPVVRRLRAAWPRVPITWIVGKVEHKLVGDLPDVEFIPFDKRAGWSGIRALRAALGGRKFGVLLHMQLSLRANFLAALVRAERRIGYDRERSKELHGLVVEERIRHRPRQHVLDALGSFVEPLGLEPGEPRWDIPIPDDAEAFAQEHLPGDQRTLVISPCSSRRWRNWSAERYAAVADHAVQRHGFRVLLCGGRSALEQETGEAIIRAMRTPVTNLIGKDTFKQMLAVLRRASVVLSPDTGPMHCANAVGTTVVGVHAATASWRSGPYSDRRYCVDRFEEAAMRFKGRFPADLRWGERVELPGAMDLVTVDDVVAAFDRYVADAEGPGAPVSER
jgi:heptosyltransferase I